ncbi:MULTISPECIES: NapC/NirT family cytochrome c [Rhodopseudomonas]|uniref:Cytochrome c-type protein n=1 Tax=Rhodopseudomonas palustris TaxID=1076 RepID=A0A0D7E1S7_RHOPL|nr:MULTISPECIES: NapC/NirT family cytochrome c [Rhodopseudomonas]KIZ34420.1 cytochrome C [Rhodopseudomonas palustris]MDF3810316.1 NapC/NirT family cytochrome c [Rhodopseudomonas sp. BAL398]WOK19892.1 NapC/NirT family cytochrome c [Rhodopseudomonas sp. BAL398]
MGSRIARLKVWLKKPVGMGTVALVAIVAAGGALAGWGAFSVALHKTNSLEFCVSCHSMKGNFEEYKKSPHYKNASGVRAVCSDCHVPKDLGPKLVAKVMAAKDVWHTILGTIDTPEKFEQHRLEMAKRVWAKMEATDSRECRSCHSQDAMDIHKQRPKAVTVMQKGLAKGETCISCHKGIAHKLPDMSSGYKSLFDDLKSQAVAKSGSADTLYALSSTPFYAEPPEGDAGNGDGKVYPLTEVKVLERKGDNIKVEVNGWVQEGVNRLMVAAKARRIFELSMSNKLADTVTLGEAEIDPDTTLSWQKASISGWVKAAAFTGDHAGLSSYGAEMASAACGACHSLPQPGHLPANQWIGVIKEMKDGTALGADEVRLLQAYFQLRAKDMPKAAH